MKRMLCVLLALLLLAGLLPTAAPSASAAVNPGFQALSQIVRDNGEYNSFYGTVWYSYSIERVLLTNGNSTTLTALGIEYFPNDNYIEVSASQRIRKTNYDYFDLSPYGYCIAFNSDGSLGTTVHREGALGNTYVDCVNGEAHYTVQPASITKTTILRAAEYLGDEPHERMDNAASTLLKETLEGLQSILSQKGRSISDFGFTAYQTGHTHKWNNGTITSAPTCGALGEIEHVCSVCKSIALEYLDPTGSHSWYDGDVIQEPSCTEEGIREQLCSRCGDRREVSIPALGHAWKLTDVFADPEEGENLHESFGCYTCSRCQETKEGRLCAGEIFTDMPKDDNWAHDPIDWAYFSGITGGKTASSFAPKAKITRAEVMTFLWTAAGKPEPTLTESPFTDVTAGKYYYKAVLWAVENKITTGKTATTFAPKAQCSRAEIMTFLWNALGKPEPTLTESPFTDVTAGKYYYKAVLWAVENNVTGGTTQTTFSPKAICTRAQVVTFLYKVRGSSFELQA